MSEEEGDEEAVTSAAPPPCWWRGRPVDAFHTALRRAVADRGLVLSHTLHASATSVVFLVAWPGGQALLCDDHSECAPLCQCLRS